MIVNSASVAVALVLSLTGTSPFEPGLVARPPAGVASLRLAAGILTTVSVPFGAHAIPPEVRAYLMLGTRAVASAVLKLR